MDDDFIYWRHPTPPGIKVEEVSGGASRQGRVWREMALQIYCENGRDGYREVGHFDSGAPFVSGSEARISVTHTDGLLCVATLPPTPEVRLGEFSERAAMGIDAERLDREKVLRVRERFLSPDELKLMPADDVAANVLAWTAKEALYKAALTPGLDFRTQIIVDSLPEIHDNPALPSAPRPVYGRARIVMPSGEVVAMRLYSYRSDDCVVTVAFSPRCARFGRQADVNDC